jgi:putative membrane protein
MMWWWGHGFGGGWAWMLMGGLMMIVFWGIVIGLVIFAIRAFARTSSGNQSNSVPQTSDTALTIAKERYARGEMNKAEYEEMLQVLKS